MARLTIGEAAALLQTAPSTIRSWEQRFGYPNPDRSTSGQRLYDEAEIALLADALRRGLGIASAVRQIREETGSHGASMCYALGELNLETSDALLEAAIALRGVSRAFDETVLAAIERLAMQDVDPGVLALAVNWAIERACWSRRNAGTPALHTTVIVDGSQEASATRAASSILRLQLTLLSARTHVLVGSGITAYRSVVRRLSADSLVFVGEPPPSAHRGNAIVSSRVAGFRTGGELLRARLKALPPEPRLAAERLLAPTGDGATGDGAARPSNGRWRSH